MDTAFHETNKLAMAIKEQLQHCRKNSFDNEICLLGIDVLLKKSSVNLCMQFTMTKGSEILFVRV